MQDCIIYEQPLNERIRNFIRLEFLFESSIALLNDGDEYAIRSSLSTLLDIHELFSRTDILTDVLKELERLAALFTHFATDPNVDTHRLNHTLDRIDESVDNLHQNFISAQSPVDSIPFLHALKRRHHLTGGSSNFNFPEFRFWLNQHDNHHLTDLKNWFSYYDHIQKAIGLVLELVRESSQIHEAIAVQGLFSQALNPSMNCQILRIGIDKSLNLFPEISASKHRFTVRIMSPLSNSKPVQSDKNITFFISLCSL